jgi:GTP-binding protein
VVLLVDASEGAMPQTKFVTAKALALGLKPIVVINKIDRPDERCDEVLNEVFDLFVALEANDQQLDFPTLYASGRNGYCGLTSDIREGTLAPLFEKILDYVPEPQVGPEDAPFAMIATMLDRDNFLGRVLTGRVQQGRVKINDAIKIMDAQGKVIEQVRASKLLSFDGLQRAPIEEAKAGDIIAIAGVTDATVGHTIGALDLDAPLKAQPIDPPTLSMTFTVNDSPLAGKEGDKVTSRIIRDRLMREAEGNVAIKITESADKDSFEVAGRGELQLGVLIETMRREGFELSISRPRVLMKTDPVTGQRLEPIEQVMVDVDEAYSGVVVEQLGRRRGELTDMRPSGGGKVRLVFKAPARGLIGYHGDFLSDTRGTGIMNRSFDGYAPYKGPIGGRLNGVLISTESGSVVAYALVNLEDRGQMMVDPGDEVYQGMVIGEHNRDNDLEVNPLKAKQLTNFRASGKDENVKLTPPKRLTLEQAIAYIQDDELVEVTPKNIRLRKRLLDPHERKRASKQVAEG